MINRKHFIASAIAAVTALSAPLAFAQQTPIVIKLSHVVSPETAKAEAALRFKTLAEKTTNGRVKIELFSNSVLYKGTEEITGTLSVGC